MVNLYFYIDYFILEEVTSKSKMIDITNNDFKKGHGVANGL